MPLPEFDTEEIEFDYRELVCKCGSIDVRIDKPPRPGSWWGNGRATCLTCGRKFSLVIDPEELRDATAD